MFVNASGQVWENPGFRVEVKDTIGSGDSFLAAFLSRWLKKDPIEKCLDYACALGAMVASHAGANPHIQEEDIKKFIS